MQFICFLSLKSKSIVDMFKHRVRIKWICFHSKFYFKLSRIVDVWELYRVHSDMVKQPQNIWFWIFCFFSLPWTNEVMMHAAGTWVTCNNADVPDTICNLLIKTIWPRERNACAHAHTHTFCLPHGAVLSVLTLRSFCLLADFLLSAKHHTFHNNFLTRTHILKVRRHAAMFVFNCSLNQN